MDILLGHIDTVEKQVNEARNWKTMKETLAEGQELAQSIYQAALPTGISGGFALSRAAGAGWSDAAGPHKNERGLRPRPEANAPLAGRGVRGAAARLHQSGHQGG